MRDDLPAMLRIAMQAGDAAPAGLNLIILATEIPSRNRGVYFLHTYTGGKINATFVFSRLS
jgi:hypothetical protein